MKWKKLVSFALVCVLLLCSALPAFASTEEECADFSSTFHRHSYDDGIVDGGVYSLRNLSSGTYLDVDNSGGAGTTVLTYAYHGGQNQRFQFFYLGKGLYEIKPLYANLRVHISGDNVVVQNKNRSTAQRFKLQLVGSRTAVILSESSGYSKAIGISGTIAQHMTYSSLSNKSVAQWAFEYADTGPASVYETFHIRNVNRNLYLDVHNESTAVGATVHGYLGLAQANQEWKMVPHASGGYSLKPVIRSDMALSYIGTYLTIQNDNTNLAQQQFYIYEAGTEASTGRKLYRIGLPTAVGIKYLTLKTQPSYATVHYYVEWTLDATDLWAFEAITADAKDPRPLTLNTWLSGSVASGYNELAYYTYKPQITSRHKIEFNGALCFPETPISAKGSGLQRRYTYNGLDVFDVLLEAGVVYYIPIRFASAAGGAYGTFSLRVRQLTFTGHTSNIDDSANRRSKSISGISYRLGEANVHFTHRENANLYEALVATNAVTGYSEFNSEIFVCNAHGNAGYAVYEEYFPVGNLLYAEYLPSMTNCELVIWATCCSASTGSTGYSMFSKSLENGAGAAIAWTGSIPVLHACEYIRMIFLGITDGKSIQKASKDALDNGSYANVDSTYAISTTIVLGGNTSHVICPQVASTATASETNMSAEATVDATMQLWNRADYTLLVENESLGVKLYSRMVNGIASDDYFMEFYDQDGKLESVRKSAYTMTNAEIAMAMAQVQQYATMHQVTAFTASAENMELQIRYVDGEWVLVEKHEVSGEECSCFYEPVFYNALTGEVIEGL